MADARRITRQVVRVAIWLLVALLAYGQMQALWKTSEAERQSGAFARLQYLRFEATALQNIIRRYHDANGTLPYNLQTIECGPPSRCDFRVWDGEVFVRMGEDWLSFRPDLRGGDLDFSCRHTLKVHGSLPDRRFNCVVVDRASLPFVWH